MHAYDRYLSVPDDDYELMLTHLGALGWEDFCLNPRYLRGADFLMRHAQGRWSEDRVCEALNATSLYRAVPYGPSGVAPDEPRELELYFERLEAAGLGDAKRPDILVFRRIHEDAVTEAVNMLGGAGELPFTPEDAIAKTGLLDMAILAVECENSLWLARQMPDYGTDLRPMSRLGGHPGLPKNAVLPTIMLKEEDRSPLRSWQDRWGIPIHIWHVFYDMAFGISLDRSDELIRSGAVEPREQTFQAPSGPTTSKILYRIYYHYGYELARAERDPDLVAERIIDKNGHVLPYVRFEGGEVALSPEALEVLGSLASEAG